MPSTAMQVGVGVGLTLHHLGTQPVLELVLCMLSRRSRAPPGGLHWQS